MIRQYALVLLLLVAPYARGLDVPFVPTPENVVAKMLELAKVGPADVVYDLQLKPGTRIVSYGFDMGEWRPAETVFVGSSVVYCWIVPKRI